MSAELIQDLQNDKWVEYPDHFRKYARCFYKRFDTPTRCALNDSKVGIQVCISVSDTTYELDVVGQLADDTWIKLHQWGMPKDYKQGLAMIPRLLATWEFIATHNNTQT